MAVMTTKKKTTKRKKKKTRAPKVTAKPSVTDSKQDDKQNDAPLPVEETGSRCTKCGSSERSNYFAIVRKNLSGEHPQKPGVMFNRVTWRRCKCLNCGQMRKDKQYELIE